MYTSTAVESEYIACASEWDRRMCISVVLVMDVGLTIAVIILQSKKVGTRQ